MIFIFALSYTRALWRYVGLYAVGTLAIQYFWQFDMPASWFPPGNPVWEIIGLYQFANPNRWVTLGFQALVLITSWVQLSTYQFLRDSQPPNWRTWFPKVCLLLGMDA